MRKRIFSASVCFLVCFLWILSCTAVNAAQTESGVLTLLNRLEIMKGDPDGSMRPEDPVTRAEFTKAAVAASSFRNSVASNLAISPFSDVTYQHWAAPYVRVGVTNGLVSGYPDATFQPENGVLYEEGITILLRVLGYTDADFGVSWPAGQLGMAKNLGMTDFIECNAGETMNRGQVARLIYNTLGVKMKGQTQQLVSIFDVQLLEDVTLIADSLDDPSVSSDEVFTSSGTYKKDFELDRTVLGDKGEAAIKDGNKLIAFVPEPNSSSSEEYVVYSVLPDAVIAYRNGIMTQLELDDTTTVYKGKTQMQYSAVKSTLELGDKLRVKHSTDGIDYVTWHKGSLAGPVTILGENWGSSWGIDSNTTVMRNGFSTSADQLQSYDIAYYLKDLNLILAYSDKVTGVYEKALPNKDTPTRISVSGTEYELEGQAAFSKLSSGGEYDFGDTITLLLGKDGRIADLLSPSAQTGNEVVGYVVETGRKAFSSGAVDNYTSYYVKVIFPDGTSGEYAADRDYQECKNTVAKLILSNGYARLSLLKDTGDGRIDGVFDWENRKLGNTPVADNAEILDIGTMNTYDASVYAHVFPQRLNGVKISSQQILYSATDASGKISKMILKNVTGDGFQYGLMTKASKLSNDRILGGKYTYLVDGQLYDLNLSGRMFNISAGSGIQIGGPLNNPDNIIKIQELSLTTESDTITYSALNHGGRSYPISASASVYQKGEAFSSGYIKIPLTDIIGKDGVRLSAYYDKGPALGGQIRILVAY